MENHPDGKSANVDPSGWRTPRPGVPTVNHQNNNINPKKQRKMGLEDDFLLEDEDDAKTVAFIQNYLPQDLKDKFTEDDLYYILDLIVEYYTTSGCLDAEPDEEGYIDIDQDEIVAYIVKEAKRDEMGPYDPEDVLFVVQGEMEYGNSIGQVE
jgi:hypothetical protein